MLLAHELRKALTVPAIAGVALLALVVNLVLIGATEEPVWPAPAEGTAMTNIYQGYQTAQLAEEYIALDRLSGTAADRVRALYDRLQPVVDQKAAQLDALDPYLGPRSSYLHGLLYGLVMPLALTEVCFLAALMALFCLGQDRTAGTQALLWSSRTGRRIQGVKLGAALLASLALTVAVLAPTLLAFVARFHYGGWADQVSSGYNQVPGPPDKPFLTWDRLTAGQYLAAQLGVGLGLVVVFTLLGAVIASLVRQAWAGVVTLAGCLIAMLLAPLPLPVASLPRVLLLETPLQLVLAAGSWFTDGGADVVWPRFETVGLAGCLIVLLLLAGLAGLRIKKEDLA